MYCNICNIENLKILLFKKKLSLCIVYSKCGHKFKKIFK